MCVCVCLSGWGGQDSCVSGLFLVPVLLGWAGRATDGLPFDLAGGPAGALATVKPGRMSTVPRGRRVAVAMAAEKPSVCHFAGPETSLSQTQSAAPTTEWKNTQAK